MTIYCCKKKEDKVQPVKQRICMVIAAIIALVLLLIPLFPTSFGAISYADEIEHQSLTVNKVSCAWNKYYYEDANDDQKTSATFNTLCKCGQPDSDSIADRKNYCPTAKAGAIFFTCLLIAFLTILMGIILFFVHYKAKYFDAVIFVIAGIFTALGVIVWYGGADVCSLADPDWSWGISFVFVALGCLVIIFAAVMAAGLCDCIPWGKILKVVWKGIKLVAKGIKKFFEGVWECILRVFRAIQALLCPKKPV